MVNSCAYVNKQNCRAKQTGSFMLRAKFDRQHPGYSVKIKEKADRKPSVNMVYLPQATGRQIGICGGAYMSIGLKRERVAVEPHRLEWKMAAQEIIDNIKNILKDDIVDAQHIGSTSIEGICAKPIVDIVVGVSSFDRMMKHNDDLMKNGIIYRGKDHPHQLLYVVGDLKNDIHTHYIHVVIWGQEAWNHYINLRDYLNAHADKAKEYSDLKERLAKEHPEDRIAYTNGKSEFIESILQMADEWRKQL